MARFVETEKRYLNDTVTIPVNFLSWDLKRRIRERLNYLPDNAYISNSAGDYVLISVVKDGKVYTYVDSYNLTSDFKDKDPFYVER